MGCVTLSWNQDLRRFPSGRKPRREGPVNIVNIRKDLDDADDRRPRRPRRRSCRCGSSLSQSRQMLPSDPAKLEARAGKRLDRDRGLGDRDHPAIADEQGGAGEIDPGPYRRHAVELVGRPAEQRRLIAPAVVDEPPAGRPGPQSTVRGRQSGGALGVESRLLAASRPARTRRKSGLAAARTATTSGGGAASAW